MLRLLVVAQNPRQLSATIMHPAIATTVGPLRVQVCGNGVTEPGEQCDDGNTQPGDGCSTICQIQ